MRSISRVPRLRLAPKERARWGALLAALVWCAPSGCAGQGSSAPPPAAPAAPSSASSDGRTSGAPAGGRFDVCDRREDGPSWLTCVVAISLREELHDVEVVEVSPLVVQVGADHVLYLDELLRSLGSSQSEDEAIAHIAQFLAAAVENLRPVRVAPEVVWATLKPEGWARDMSARLALENLRRALALPAVHLASTGHAPAEVRSADLYDAARLLLPELWAPVAERVGGELVVAAPDRDLLLVVDGRDVEAVRALRARARSAFAAGAHPVGAALFRYTPTGFVPLDAS